LRIDSEPGFIDLFVGLVQTKPQADKKDCNHFLSTKYVNDGATSNQYVSPSGSGFNLRETPITVENRVNGFYLEVDTGNNPIYPASLGFTNGFKSSTIGSKITFIQKSNGTVWVINKVGDWITA
jgi:hypothetical protein